MAVTLVGTVLDAADSGTGWTGVTNVDTDSEVQGTGCLGTKVSNATTNTTYGTTQDLSAGGSNPDYHIVMWLHCLTPTLNTQAAGGFRVTVTDTTSTKEYYVGGSDNRKQGWGAYVVSPRIASDVNGTPVSASITSIGGTVSTNATIMGNFNNGLWDQLTIGEGMRWTSTGGTFASFVAADEGDKTNGTWGWLRTVANQAIIIPQCKFYIGDGSTTTTFSDSAVLMVFEPATGVATTYTVDDDFYEINVTAAAQMTLSGNSFISAAGSAQWTLTVNSSTSASSFTNSTFDNCRSITIQSNTTFDTMTVTNSGAITTNGATLTDCTIVDQTGKVTVANLNQIDNCTFTHNGTPGNAIELGTITSTTAMDWDAKLNYAGWVGTAQTYTGSNTDTDAAINVSVNSGQTLTINVAAGASIPTIQNAGTGDVVVQAGVVSFALTGLKDGTEVRIHKTSDSTDVAGVEDMTGGVGTEETTDVVVTGSTDNNTFTYTYTYTADTGVYAVILNNQYEYLRLNSLTLGSTNQSIPVQQRFDRNFSNP